MLRPYRDMHFVIRPFTTNQHLPVKVRANNNNNDDDWWYDNNNGYDDNGDKNNDGGDEDTDADPTPDALSGVIHMASNWITEKPRTRQGLVSK